MTDAPDRLPDIAWELEKGPRQAACSLLTRPDGVDLVVEINAMRSTQHYPDRAAALERAGALLASFQTAGWKRHEVRPGEARADTRWQLMNRDRDDE